MKLEVGDIIFYKSNSFIGKVITKLTDSEYSHVAMYVGDNQIVEADRFIKSRKTELNVVDKRLIKVMRVNGGLDEQRRMLLLASLPHVLGKSYDYVRIGYLFIKLLLNMDTKNIVNDLNTFFCSELVDYLYLLIGIDLVPHVESHVVTPHDLEVSPELYDIVIT